ncbi:MAG: ABC transporter permease [Clostridia bacterium]|nr:ABC transporter permease [Clostridia bacterium]
MNLFENIKMAFESILSNKLRSILTMLGIIIGISSVITIVSLGQGGQNTITGEFEKIGASSVSIKVDTQKAEKSDYITFDDVEQVKEKIEYVKYSTPTIQKQGIIASDIKSKRAFIIGGSEDMQYIQNFEMVSGRFYNNIEYLEGKPVVIIDEIAAKSLFGTDNVIGNTIDIGPRSSTRKATIVGIYKSQMGMFAGGDDNNMPAFVYVPARFVNILYSNDSSIDTMTIMADSKDNMESAGNAAINMLENRHGNRDRQVYKADNVLKQLDQINKVLGIFTAFIGAVAAISLLVGGIGVMNIMLVSVTERTREIGIRKAIGARTGTILFQFLTESVIISCLGGIIGLIIGIAGAYGIGSFANITPSVSPGIVIVAILFSSAVGIFFGIYPARKAARLDPIEALRYE